MADDVFHRILHAQAAQARAIDDDRLEDWPAFFADPCLYKITTAADFRDGLEAGLLFANSPGMLRDRVSALREANIYERQSYRHILGAPLIGQAGEGGTASETAFLVLRIMRDGTTDIFASGKYLDRWRLDGSDARLAERIVVCDSARIDTLLALPL
ncbi:MAG TPA: aromatic-ring-hydroxylating dioxygenase subunit beta [Hyphomicrobiales bacterium]|nr:aromatic-ring-hydroxylating dioxygenase subunit beta [Hyphomicrobiales bacterium]